MSAVFVKKLGAYVAAASSDVKVKVNGVYSAISSLKIKVNGAYIDGDAAPVPTQYNYLTSSALNPPAGSVYCATGGINLVFNAVDVGGKNHTSDIPGILIGSTITIGSRSGVTTSAPVAFGQNVWTIPVASWTAPLNGLHTVTVTAP